MRPGTLLIILLALLAGCTGPASSVPEQGVTHELTWSDVLHVGVVRSPVLLSPLRGENCLLVAIEQPVRTGEVHLVWTPQSPMTEELDLSVGRGPDEFARARGPSPMRVILPPIPASAEEIDIILYPSGPEISAAAEQPVRVEIRVVLGEPATMDVTKSRCAAA